MSKRIEKQFLEPGKDKWDSNYSNSSRYENTNADIFQGIQQHQVSAVDNIELSLYRCTNDRLCNGLLTLQDKIGDQLAVRCQKDSRDIVVNKNSSSLFGYVNEIKRAHHRALGIFSGIGINIDDDKSDRHLNLNVMNYEMHAAENHIGSSTCKYEYSKYQVKMNKLLVEKGDQYLNEQLLVRKKRDLYHLKELHIATCQSQHRISTYREVRLRMRRRAEERRRCYVESLSDTDN